MSEWQQEPVFQLKFLLEQQQVAFAIMLGNCLFVFQKDSTAGCLKYIP